MSNATTNVQSNATTNVRPVRIQVLGNKGLGYTSQANSGPSNVYVLIAVIVFIATIIPVLRKDRDSISDIMKTSNLETIPVLLMCIYVFYKRISNRGDIPGLLKGILILFFLALCFLIFIYFFISYGIYDSPLGPPDD